MTGKPKCVIKKVVFGRKLVELNKKCQFRPRTDGATKNKGKRVEEKKKSGNPAPKRRELGRGKLLLGGGGHKKEHMGGGVGKTQGGHPNLPRGRESKNKKEKKQRQQPHKR